MPLIEIRSFSEGLLDDAEEIVQTVEELERIRRDARTTMLLVSARKFFADVQAYFQEER